MYRCDTLTVTGVTNEAAESDICPYDPELWCQKDHTQDINYTINTD
jgi:hypothetical protein